MKPSPKARSILQDQPKNTRKMTIIERAAEIQAEINSTWLRIAEFIAQSKITSMNSPITGQTMQTRITPTTMTVKGVEITVDYETFVCDEPEGQFESEEMLQRNLDRVNEAVRERLQSIQHLHDNISSITIPQAQELIDDMKERYYKPIIQQFGEIEAAEVEAYCLQHAIDSFQLSKKREVLSRIETHQPKPG